MSDGLSGKSGGLQSEEFADASSSEGDDSACDRLLEEFARTELATDAVSLPPIGTVVAEKYRIVSMLGRGGMGAVFKVRHEITRKVFALKWMLPGLSRNADAVQRFLLEASTSGRVVHRNLVDIYDVGEQGGSHYMVMEFVDGETLAQRLTAQSQLGVSEVCRVLIGVMRGLAAAHQAGIIHRDLKPQNIILFRTELGEELPKVLDFGVSKFAPMVDDPTLPETTRSSTPGTVNYMAPEQLRSEPVDARTDVYALGVIAYELLTGARPFTGDTIPALIHNVLTASVAPLHALRPSLQPELAEIVAKAMARASAARFSSTEEFARALEPFADGMRFAPRDQGERAAGASREPVTNVTAPTSAISLDLPVRRNLKRRSHVAAMVAVAVMATLATALVLYSGASRVESLPSAPPVPVATPAVEPMSMSATPVEVPVEAAAEPAVVVEPKPPTVRARKPIRPKAQLPATADGSNDKPSGVNVRDFFLNRRKKDEGPR